MPPMGNDMIDDCGRANLLYGELVVRTMMVLGIEHFVVSPGSRSSPLTMALEGLESDRFSVVLDERSAAFLALGRIKATRKPVALICTSGTAGAHYYPAVIEARESGLPLVVLTADRPPELRHCHAGQTIDQSRLFGRYPVFQTELPVAGTNELLLRQVRDICRVAVESAMGVPGGPVHVNCPFREPFFPIDADKPVFDPVLTKGLHPVNKASSSSGIVPQLPQRTVILAGPRPASEPVGEPGAIQELARKFGWPILADAANPLRHQSDPDNPVIAHYDRIARDDALWKELAPDKVLLWGEPPTSKALRQKLTDLDIAGYLVNDGKHAINPIHGKIHWACSSMVEFLNTCSGHAGDYARAWQDADERMEQRLGAALEQPHALFEGDIHRSLAAILPEQAPVFLASSLAIRDADWFMPANDRRYRPFSQRGANGIDGTVSLARGIASGLKQPAWLVTGDLAFLHDGNGLLDSSRDHFGLFIILVNNQGGGIFEMLPVAQKCDRFEELYATPQIVDHAKLVAAHGGSHQLCASIGELESAVKNWQGKGIYVAELRIDRKVSRVLHKQYLVMND